jgi:pilus assembly protein CpaD
MARYLVTALVPLLLGACTSEWDMYGVDPKDYYAAHPVENRVETKNTTYTVHFQPDADRLTGDDIASLRGSVRDISPLAVESVQIQMHPSQVKNQNRQQHLTKLLRSMGYPERAIIVEPSETLTKDDVQVNIAYASVISPRCPDWRRSPITSYSNTSHGNIGCASTTNLGLMVADPRDLVHGEGNVSPDSQRNSTVIQNYRSGVEIAPAPASSGTSGSGGASASQPAQ